MGDYICEVRLSRQEMYVRACTGVSFTLTASDLKALIDLRGKSAALQELRDRLLATFGDTINLADYAVDCSLDGVVTKMDWRGR